ncbi:winged helix-turn-helix transcriptional regulator [Pseudoclavibacter chungangensis]|uniref:Winged helix-turn-helix transcriptional regulator n=1 Tax=Pseudoclavibacter chungangensis TaxID=587635 RepID=A0A7J5C216_9MICO|nr:MarR family winged helix-turn-helix transcriptional regulator [Pseudoclavibacter chungangensis]KAB1660071.1 winged helix-turn-helix transcriptional regulator [Pseudoclavibacter chungangensis]NYJ66830.1 DNA-binding MarR family transcriptional regulator [Pseudoclavibacter chungangensis]
MTSSTSAHDREPGDTEAEIDALEHEFVRFFARARAMWKTAATEIEPELQPVGYKLLVNLHRDGPRRAGDLAAATETDKSVVSRQLRFLESRGLVEGMPDPDDGRSRIYAATPEASARLDATGSRLRARQHGWLAEWEGDRVRTLTALLAELNTGLDELARPTEPAAERAERTTDRPGTATVHED